MGDGRWEVGTVLPCLGEESIVASDSLIMSHPRGRCEVKCECDLLCSASVYTDNNNQWRISRILSFLHSFIHSILECVLGHGCVFPPSPPGCSAGVEGCEPAGGAGRGGRPRYCFSRCCQCMHVCGFVCLLMLPHRASMLTGELAGSRSPSRQRTRQQTRCTGTGNQEMGTVTTP